MVASLLRLPVTARKRRRRGRRGERPCCRRGSDRRNLEQQSCLLSLPGTLEDTFATNRVPDFPPPLEPSVASITRTRLRSCFEDVGGPRLSPSPSQSESSSLRRSLLRLRESGCCFHRFEFARAHFCPSAWLLRRNNDCRQPKPLLSAFFLNRKRSVRVTKREEIEAG